MTPQGPWTPDVDMRPETLRALARDAVRREADRVYDPRILLHPNTLAELERSDRG